MILTLLVMVLMSS